MIKSMQDFIDYYAAKQIYIPDESISLPRYRKKNEMISLLSTKEVFLPLDYINFCNDVKIEGCSINFFDLSPGSAESIEKSINFLNESGNKNPALGDNMTHFASFDSDLVVFEHSGGDNDDYNVSYVDVSTSKSAKKYLLSNKFIQFIFIISSIDFFIDQNSLNEGEIIESIFHPNSEIAPPVSSREKWTEILSQML